MAGRRDDSGFGGMIVTFGGMNVISGGMVMISGGLTMTKWSDECDFWRDELIPHFKFGTPVLHCDLLNSMLLSIQNLRQPAEILDQKTCDLGNL